MDKIPAIFSWSGGKDSSYALHKILNEGLYDVKYLLSTIK
jgi:diphthamide synthase (EF-2-diphthine--ammonia ligase)